MSDKLAKTESAIETEDFGEQLVKEMQIAAKETTLAHLYVSCAACGHASSMHGYQLTNGSFVAGCNHLSCMCICFVEPKKFRNGASTGLF